MMTNLRRLGSFPFLLLGLVPLFFIGSIKGAATESSASRTTRIQRQCMTLSPDDASARTPRRRKRILWIRHGLSEANEWMARKGNEWGDPTFTDDTTLKDARLSARGSQQVVELRETLRRKHRDILDAAELILTSPLTRCLQTCEAVHPFVSNQTRLLAHPLLTERVFTASDTGRDKQSLQREFPHVTFPDSLVEQPWWYECEDDDQYREWRPTGQGQYYAVPGEPDSVFEERMRKLRQWLDARDEDTLIVVTHWGVLRHLIQESEFDNAESRLVEWSCDEED